jgi:pyruvate/2-oxoglutarate dehydrogenase complex dihydrolipoamide acyltransferase (E2) component
MGAYGIQSGTPVVVPPGVATLFVGEAYYAQDPHSAEPSIRKYVNIGLTIDHRLINGVGGALLMNAVKKNVENISELVR